MTEPQIQGWLAEPEREEWVDPDALRAETAEKIAAWNDLGRGLCSRFVEVAERHAAGRIAA